MDRTTTLALIAFGLLSATPVTASAQSRVSTSGNTTTFYDAGRVISRATTNGNTTTNYDSRGRVISRETINGDTTTIYDPAGRNIGRYTTKR